MCFVIMASLFCSCPFWWKEKLNRRRNWPLLCFGQNAWVYGPNETMYRTSEATCRAQSKVGPLKGRGRAGHIVRVCFWCSKVLSELNEKRIQNTLVSVPCVCYCSGGFIKMWNSRLHLPSFTHCSPSYRVRLKAGLSQKPGDPDLLLTTSVSYTPTTSPRLTPPYLHLSLVATLIKSVVLRPWLLPPLPDPLHL